MKLRDWVPPPHGSEHVPQASIAPVQSTGHAMAVLHGCVSTLPAAAAHAAPPLAAVVVIANDRVATPLGPQVSEQLPRAP
jgi:hypothetical protein